MKLKNPTAKSKDYYPSGLIVNCTYVCKSCNSTGRSAGKCPKCKIMRVNVGKRAKIPKKNDVKGWCEFWEWYEARISRLNSSESSDLNKSYLAVENEG